MISLSRRASRIPVTLAAVSVAGLAALASHGCGNAWITSKERENSPSALMTKAQFAYDKGDFEKAAEYFGKVVDKDPTNEKARIRLAYAINGRAGLSPFDLVTKLTNLKSPTASSGASATMGGSTGSSSTSSITQFTNLVGLDAADKTAIANALKSKPKTIGTLRSVSPRFALLHESWLAACQLVPKDALDLVIASNTTLRSAFEVTSCKGGLTDPARVKSSALFAVVMMALAQGSGLYQTVLDANGDGKVDLEVQATQIQQEVTALSNQSGGSAEQIGARMQAINEKLALLGALGKEVTGELVTVALAHFEFVAKLSAKIIFPDDVNKKMTDAITKFNETRDKLNQFTKTGASQSSSTNKVQDAAKKASASLDKMYDERKAAAGSDPAKVESLNQDMTKACTNFDALKAQFGLPADVTKPTKCAAAGAGLTGFALTDAHDGTAWEPAGSEAASSEGADAFDAPEALGLSADSSEGEEALEGVVEFARHGEALLQD